MDQNDFCLPSKRFFPILLLQYQLQNCMSFFLYAVLVCLHFTVSCVYDFDTNTQRKKLEKPFENLKKKCIFSSSFPFDCGPLQNECTNYEYIYKYTKKIMNMISNFHHVLHCFLWIFFSFFNFFSYNIFSSSLNDSWWLKRIISIFFQFFFYHLIQFFHSGQMGAPLCLLNNVG